MDRRAQRRSLQQRISVELICTVVLPVLPITLQKMITRPCKSPVGWSQILGKLVATVKVHETHLVKVSCSSQLLVFCILGQPVRGCLVLPAGQVPPTWKSRCMIWRKLEDAYLLTLENRLMCTSFWPGATVYPYDDTVYSTGPF